MNMEYVLSRFIHRLNENKVLMQRHIVYSFDFPIISRVRCGLYSKGGFYSRKYGMAGISQKRTISQYNTAESHSHYAV